MSSLYLALAAKQESMTLACSSTPFHLRAVPFCRNGVIRHNGENIWATSCPLDIPYCPFNIPGAMSGDYATCSRPASRGNRGAAA